MVVQKVSPMPMPEDAGTAPSTALPDGVVGTSSPTAGAVMLPPACGSNLAVLARGAFEMMRSELSGIPGAPRNPREFLERLTSDPKPTKPEGSVATDPLQQLGTLWSVPQAAVALKVCRKTVLNMVAAGRLEHIRSGALIRIPSSAILALRRTERGA